MCMFGSSCAPPSIRWALALQRSSQGRDCDQISKLLLTAVYSKFALSFYWVWKNGGITARNFLDKVDWAASYISKWSGKKVIYMYCISDTRVST